MLKVFTAYRTTAALGLCVTAAMTALFIAMGEAAFSIFIIVLGLWITWLASLYKAMREHQAMLDVLYQEMDALSSFTGQNWKKRSRAALSRRPCVRISAMPI